MFDIYIKQIRSLLEISVPVWAGTITKDDSSKIERVQRCALTLIFNYDYFDYRKLLNEKRIESLESRRKK